MQFIVGQTYLGNTLSNANLNKELVCIKRTQKTVTFQDWCGEFIRFTLKSSHPRLGELATHNPSGLGVYANTVKWR